MPDRSSGQKWLVCLQPSGFTDTLSVDTYVSDIPLRPCKYVKLVAHLEQIGNNYG